MARYKVLHSIAHNFGQSFVGASRARADDHLLEHLLADCRRTQERTLWVDIFTGEAKPDVLVSRTLARALERYVREFPDLVAGAHTDMQVVKAARMELTFDLSTERPRADATNRLESPYVCTVEIDDDRGKTWTAELRGWCAPEMRGVAAGLFGRLTGR
jgi:hypothetical protein